MISDEYKDLLTQKHVFKAWGGSGKSWLPWILPILNRFNEHTVLDFGCGRGTLKPALEQLRPDCTVHEYDPGVPGKDVLRMVPVDYVVCTDVMEHVEEQFVDVTLKTIQWLAIHGVFFNIDLKPSRSLLPDGSNCHITLKPSEWWEAKLAEFMPDMRWTIHERKSSRLVISGLRGNPDAE